MAKQSTLRTARGYPLKGATGRPMQFETVDSQTREGRSAGRRLGMKMPGRDQTPRKKPKKTPRLASGAPRGWTALKPVNEQPPRVVSRG